LAKQENATGLFSVPLRQMHIGIHEYAGMELLGEFL
jgi:hypothetical protein